MKLFTSLAASVALTEAQGQFGDFNSLADLFAQFNAGDIGGFGDFADVAASVDDVTANATDIDPLTGERYLVGNALVDCATLTKDSPITTQQQQQCDPCAVGGSKYDSNKCTSCNAACDSTYDDNGVLKVKFAGATTNDGMVAKCDCTKMDQCPGKKIHKEETADAGTWAGPECQCKRCSPHDGNLLAANAGEESKCTGQTASDNRINHPCIGHNRVDGDTNGVGSEQVGNGHDTDDTNPPTGDVDGTSNIDDENVCTVVNDNEFQCDCDSGKYDPLCESNKPCLVDDNQVAPVVCNGGIGTNSADNLSCSCDCTQMAANQAPNPPMSLTGTACNEGPCHPNRNTINDCSLPGAESADASDDTGVDNSGNATCKCKCNPGYGGDKCETDLCAAVTCTAGQGTLNRSDCSCTCYTGFSGDRCQTVDPVVTGTGCWKCDAMTYTDCATKGEFKTCSDDNEYGDNGVCFVEYREQNQKLTQLCTGCKDKRSCDDLKRQNFVPGFNSGNTADEKQFMRMRNQCKPDYSLQVSRRRYGKTQSVCRQCFSMCENTAEKSKQCFGGMGDPANFGAGKSDTAKINAAQWIRYYHNIVGQSSWTSATDRLLRNDDDAMVLGIPLMIPTDNRLHADDVTIVNSNANHVFRGYSPTELTALSAASGQTSPLVGPPTDTNTDDNKKQLFWALADATEFFWNDDLIAHQAFYSSDNNKPVDTTPADGVFDSSIFEARGYDETKPCEIDYGQGKTCDRS
jgi:hypothetical protein